jgi:hypothetical protein
MTLTHTPPIAAIVQEGSMFPFQWHAQHARRRDERSRADRNLK